MSDKGCNNQQLRSPHLSLLVPPPSLQVCCIPTPPSCLPLQSGMARTCRGTGCCSCCCACCCACCCPTSPGCPWPCGCDTCTRPPVPGSFVLNLGFRTAPPGWLPPEGSGSVPPAGRAEGGVPGPKGERHLDLENEVGHGRHMLCFRWMRSRSSFDQGREIC